MVQFPTSYLCPLETSRACPSLAILTSAFWYLASHQHPPLSSAYIIRLLERGCISRLFHILQQSSSKTQGLVARCNQSSTLIPLTPVSWFCYFLNDCNKPLDRQKETSREGLIWIVASKSFSLAVWTGNDRVHSSVTVREKMFIHSRPGIREWGWSQESSTTSQCHPEWPITTM